MDIVNQAFDLLGVYAEMAFDFIAPYMVEIIIAFIIATFFFGLIQNNR